VAAHRSPGRIADVQIVSPSGSAAVGESVLLAVRQTKQASPPPAGMDGTLRLDFIVPWRVASRPAHICKIAS